MVHMVLLSELASNDSDGIVKSLVHRAQSVCCGSVANIRSKAECSAAIR